MAYQDQYGGTTIRDTKQNNLQISYEPDEDDDGNEVNNVVLLFTPNMDDTNQHFHISLNINQAAELSNWLFRFLKDNHD